MRQLIAAVVLALLCIVSTSAQPPIYSVVDWHTTNVVIAGWSLDCSEGSRPAGLEVQVSDAETGAVLSSDVLQPRWYVPQSVGGWVLYPGLQRPDVLAAFAGACPLLATHDQDRLGFHLYRSTPLLPGRYRVSVRYTGLPVYAEDTQLVEWVVQ